MVGDTPNAEEGKRQMVGFWQFETPRECLRCALARGTVIETNSNWMPQPIGITRVTMSHESQALSFASETPVLPIFMQNRGFPASANVMQTTGIYGLKANALFTIARGFAWKQQKCDAKPFSGITTTQTNRMQ